MTRVPTHLLVFLFSLIALVLCTSTNAFAQEDELAVTAQELVLTSTTSTTTTTMAVFEYYFCADIPGTCDVVTSSTQISMSSYSRRGRRVSMFVQANAVSLQQGVALGGGDILVDFARILSIPKTHDRAFAQMLRRERKKVLPLISYKKDNLLETFELVELLYDAIKRDPNLNMLVKG